MCNCTDTVELMKICGKSCCRVRPSLQALQPGACTEATLPSQIGNDAGGKRFRSNEVKLHFCSNEI